MHTTYARSISVSLPVDRYNYRKRKRHSCPIYFASIFASFFFGLYVNGYICIYVPHTCNASCLCMFLYLSSDKIPKFVPKQCRINISSIRQIPLMFFFSLMLFMSIPIITWHLNFSLKLLTFSFVLHCAVARALHARLL